MNVINKYRVAQTVTNQNVELVVPTLLTVDGRMGWNLKRFTTILSDVAGVAPTAKATISCQLNTETGQQLFTDADNIAINLYLFQGIAASTSAGQVQPQAEWRSVDGRLTVQPNLYLLLATSGLTAVQVVLVELEYETVKLTDMEVMRLLQGGA